MSEHPHHAHVTTTDLRLCTFCGSADLRARVQVLREALENIAERHDGHWTFSVADCDGCIARAALAATPTPAEPTEDDWPECDCEWDPEDGHWGNCASNRPAAPAEPEET